MTIKEVIDAVDTLKPNQYSIAEKVQWLSFVDEKIINDVLKTHEGYDEAYDEFNGYCEDDLTVSLIVESPYDRLYPAFVSMKIDECNGDTQKYNNSYILYNNYLLEYRKYYNKTHMPLPVGMKVAVKPCKPIEHITEAQIEAITRDLYYSLSDDLRQATSPDVIYGIVMNYVNNNAQMLKGKDGEPGKDGKDGKNGIDGTVTFDELSPAQKESLKGDKGAKGDKGDPFTYDDFTEEQLASLKGEKGDKGEDGVTPDLSNYVQKTDAPDYNVPSLIKVKSDGSGIRIKEGFFSTTPASEGHIDNRHSKEDYNRVINPKILDYAVKAAIANNSLALTVAEKASALNWLGALSSDNGVANNLFIEADSLYCNNLLGTFKYLHEGDVESFSKISVGEYVGAGEIVISQICSFDPYIVIVFGSTVLRIMSKNIGVEINGTQNIVSSGSFSYSEGRISFSDSASLLAMTGTKYGWIAFGGKNESN